MKPTLEQLESLYDRSPSHDATIWINAHLDPIKSFHRIATIRGSHPNVTVKVDILLQRGSRAAVWRAIANHEAIKSLSQMDSGL